MNKFIEAEDYESRRVAREVAAEGTVLLKNEDFVLPLDSKLDKIKTTGTKRVAIIGEDAGPGHGPNYCEDRACNQGTLAVGWGSGATEFTYLIDPLSALNSSFDHQQVEVTASLSNKVNRSLRDKLDKQDLCMVFANADAGEGYLAWSGVRADRPNLDLQKDGAKLVKDVADACGGSVVLIIHAVGPVNLAELIDLPKVKAILHANLPGQESGNALADVIFGKVDASGRLPYTIGKSLDDYGPGAPVLYYPNQLIPQADFNEGLYIDYRHFDKANIEPLYPFGFGLSYTSFEYSDLKITPLKTKSRLPAPRPLGIQPPTSSDKIPAPSSALYPSGFRKFSRYIYPYIKDVNQVKTGKYPYPEGYEQVQSLSQAGGGEGGNPSLFEEYVKVDFKVRNSGDRRGKEVVQLYVSIPTTNEKTTGDLIDMPKQVLRNFTKLEMQAGSIRSVSLTLSRKDLSYWSVIEQNWVMPDGEFSIRIGSHSQDVRLSGTY